MAEAYVLRWNGIIIAAMDTGDGTTISYSAVRDFAQAMANLLSDPDLIHSGHAVEVLRVDRSQPGSMPLICETVRPSRAPASA
jgi:hypothetical protein